jgi:peptidoglycan/xylan/chitin deacetylase (PgdA/CDA1 family)
VIRNLLKAGTASLLHHTHLDRAFGTLVGASQLPVILGYHRVVEDFEESCKTSMPSLLISQQMLERHLDWMAKRHEFIDLDDLGGRLESGERLEKPLAALTFDDGYSDFCHQAAPLLKRKGIPAAVFVVTDNIGTTVPQVHDKLYYLLTQRSGRRTKRHRLGLALPNIDKMSAYQATRILIETLPLNALLQVIRTLENEGDMSAEHLDSCRSLNWEELDRIRKDGFIIGSHTRSHIVMTNETLARVGKELSESRLRLESQLGIPIKHFAYPSGLYNNNCVDAVASAGYKFGYTGCLHRSATHPLLTVPRTVLWENSSLDMDRTFSGSVLSCQIHRTFDLLNGCRQRHEATS